MPPLEWLTEQNNFLRRNSYHHHHQIHQQHLHQQPLYQQHIHQQHLHQHRKHYSLFMGYIIARLRSYFIPSNTNTCTTTTTTTTTNQLMSIGGSTLPYHSSFSTMQVIDSPLIIYLNLYTGIKYLIL